MQEECMKLVENAMYERENITFPNQFLNPFPLKVSNSILQYKHKVSIEGKEIILWNHWTLNLSNNMLFSY